jgi:membrane protease YdiL (CAAX protease family)
MTGEATSPAVVRWAPAEWRAFGAFLRRPVLPERVTGIRLHAIAATLKLFALDAALMAVLLALVGMATTFGVKFPANAIDNIKLGPLVLALIVVFAPVVEELIFRSWLSGRPGHVAAPIALVLGLAIPILSGVQGYPVLLLGGLAIGAAVALGLLVWLRKHPPFPFFSRHFVWFYAAASLLFALAHLTNYAGDAGAILLVLVVPQLLVGLILGYARVTYGLWSDMLLHMLHNGVLIGLLVLQKGMG